MKGRDGGIGDRMENIEIVYQKMDQLNEKCYDNCAYLWDRFPFPDSLPKLIDKYYDPLLGNKVLDVGSGTGVLAKWLADKGFNLLCLDPSSEMVRRCREKGLCTLQCSIQSYLPDCQFAMVFAILSLMHIPKIDFAAQIKKLADALPPKGLLFLAMLEGQGEGLSENGSYPRFFAYYTSEEIEKITALFFSKIDCSYVHSGHISYILFVLEKNIKFL